MSSDQIVAEIIRLKQKSADVLNHYTYLVGGGMAIADKPLETVMAEQKYIRVAQDIAYFEKLLGFVDAEGKEALANADGLGQQDVPLPSEGRNK